MVAKGVETMGCKLVAYYRVSTDKQGKSGLGLEAQQAAVESYSKMTGCGIIAAYKEVESGKGKGTNRPELVKALAHAKRSKATLVIAKLDRLSRNVAFLANLLESGVDFVACDNPNANRLTIHILAAVAEDEARRISDRTKAALAAYKARGGKLGTDNLTDEARVKGNQAASVAVRENATKAYSDVAPVIRQFKAEGLTLRAIADRLNADGHTTRTGKPWNQVQVMRVLGRD